MRLIHIQLLLIGIMLIVFQSMMIPVARQARRNVPANIKDEVVNAEIEKRLDNNQITYYPSDAVRLLQVSLQGEGYDIVADGIFGQETLTAITRWQEGQR